MRKAATPRPARGSIIFLNVQNWRTRAGFPEERGNRATRTSTDAVSSRAAEVSIQELTRHPIRSCHKSVEQKGYLNFAIHSHCYGEQLPRRAAIAEIANDCAGLMWSFEIAHLCQLSFEIVP